VWSLGVILDLFASDSCSAAKTVPVIIIQSEFRYLISVNLLYDFRSCYWYLFTVD
jgi:hypothetical protein